MNTAYLRSFTKSYPILLKFDVVFPKIRIEPWDLADLSCNGFFRQ